MLTVDSVVLFRETPKRGRVSYHINVFSRDCVVLRVCLFGVCIVVVDFYVVAHNQCNGCTVPGLVGSTRQGDSCGRTLIAY